MKKRRATNAGTPRLKALWHALDEAAFGPERTLNLREALPTALEARAKADVWLRARQVTRTEEVLVITGRGNQSPGGIGVIREAILGMLPSLRRRGIVESWREHSPGSIVVKLAPVTALISAGRRRRDTTPHKITDPEIIEGLKPETRRMLKDLALQNLQSLGIVATDHFIRGEMSRTFSALMTSVPDGPNREAALHNAILNAIHEHDDR